MQIKANFINLKEVANPVLDNEEKNTAPKMIQLKWTRLRQY